MIYFTTQFAAATIHAVVILLLSTVTGIIFFRSDKTAGLLFVPCVLWLIFSTILLYQCWVLNSEKSEKIENIFDDTREINFSKKLPELKIKDKIFEN